MRSEWRKENIKRTLKYCWSIFLKNDLCLLENDVSERAIVHKYAEYLQQEFTDWNVDCEYNKNFDNPKLCNAWKQKKEEIIKKIQRATGLERQGKLERLLQVGVSVYPDIIIHHRGTDDNLLVIEAKKTMNDTDYEIDKEKLKECKSSLEYQFACFLTFRTKRDEDKSLFEPEFI